jgi:hypothetical protein
VVFPRLANRGFEVQWTTNLLNSSSWQSLNVPENRPLFPAADETAHLSDGIAVNAQAKFYRVLVYEP